MSVSGTRLIAVKLLAGLLLLSVEVIPYPAQQNATLPTRRKIKADGPDPAEVEMVRQAAHPLTGGAGGRLTFKRAGDLWD